ncbi:MAG: hypothetical protein GXO65_04720 [Euryarchaeota archaeon]|nr:hypothetical protein [Euryarchaeota archaeon]
MLEFKVLSEEDTACVREGLGEFGVGLEELAGDGVLVGSYGGRLEVFRTGRRTLEVMERAGRRPYCAGLYVGEIRGGRFLLGLEGAAIIAPHTDRKVVVNRKAEQLVLYGRDVLHKSVLHLPKNLKPGHRCLIVDEEDEVLGLGRMEKDCIRNIMDRGWYLRKGE